MVEAAKTDADLQATEAKAQDELDAARAVAGAESALAAQRDLFEQVGLSGTDPGTALPAAIAAAKSGDKAGTLAQVASITAALDGAAGVGQQRVGFVVGFSVVLLVVLLLVVRRSRRRRRAATEPALASMAAATLATEASEGVPNLAPVAADSAMSGIVAPSAPAIANPPGDASAETPPAGT
jgi:hypothetical protein